MSAEAGNRPRETAPRTTTALKVVAVAFILLLVVPLYLLIAMVLIRSDLLSFRDDEFTDEQFKALWTFIGAGVAAIATILGAILTKSHNDRSLAVQADAERRKNVLENEASDRMRLDTVVQGIGLIATDGKYAPRPVVAGGLATLVELGHPPIAMRVLAAALDDDGVDSETATWLINKGLVGKWQGAVESSASLLNRHARKFTDSSAPGFFSWPDGVTASWIVGLSPNAALNVLNGLIELLLSQPKDWWEGSWGWVMFTLDEAVRLDRDGRTKANAATWLTALLAVSDENVTIQGLQGNREPQEVRERATHTIQQFGWRDFLPVDRVKAWAEEPAKQVSMPAPWSLPTTTPPPPPPSGAGDGG